MFLGTKLRTIPAIPLFARILLAFVLVVVPIYLVSFFLYQSGLQTVRERLLEAEQQQARLGLQNLEREIQRVQAVVIQFGENYQLRKLALESTIDLGWDKVQDIQTLQSSLYLMSGISPLVEDCWVWLPYLARKISPWDADLVARGGEPPIPPALRPVSGADGFSISLPFPANYRTTGLQFMISTQFSQRKMLEYLQTIVRFSGGSACMAVGNPRKYIGAPPGPEIIAMAEPELTDPAAQREFQGRLPLDGKMQVVSIKQSDSLDLAIILSTPEDQVLGPLAYLSAWFAGLTVLTGVLVIFFTVWTTSSIERPLHALVDGLRKVEHGDLKVNLNSRRRDEFGFLYRQFDSMVAGLDRTMTRLIEQETLVRQAELKQLQYQINPHFLYNSIYHMYRMARAEDYECIADYALHLGSYFEFITRGGGGMTTLAEEAVHARNYMEIQRIRFGGRIQPHIVEPAGRAAAVPVPRLILQPLLENAYNHGLANCPGGGLIQLLVEEQTDWVDVIVQDNGPDLEDGTIAALRDNLARSDTGEAAALSGLINIHRRLGLQFGRESGLRLDRGPIGGLRVMFRIPITGEW